MYVCTHIHTYLQLTWDDHLYIQPIADRVNKNLEIISKNFQISTRRTRILMRFIIGTMLLPGTNRKSYVHNSGSLKKI